MAPLTASFPSHGGNNEEFTANIVTFFMHNVNFSHFYSPNIDCLAHQSDSQSAPDVQLQQQQDNRVWRLAGLLDDLNPLGQHLQRSLRADRLQHNEPVRDRKHRPILF